MSTSKTIELPCYGIKVTVNNHDGLVSGLIFSDLIEENRIAGKEAVDYAMHGIENMILAAACAGLDIQSPAFLEAIETAVDACTENLESEC